MVNLRSMSTVRKIGIACGVLALGVRFDEVGPLRADQLVELFEVRDLDGEAIHALVYSLAREVPGAKPAELFQAIYLALLGKPRGPRAGWFVAALGAEFSAARFCEAAGERA